MATSFETVLLSRPFKFLIGPNEVEIMVHEEAIASQSIELKALMRGEMSEGKTGVATWADFVYTGDYSVPKMIVSDQIQQKPIQKEERAQSEEDEERLIEVSLRDAWASPSSKKIKKLKKSSYWSDGFKESSQSAQTDFLTTYSKSRKYLLQPRSKFADSCNPEVISGAEENITEALLTHSSLYILAEKWGISSLKMLTTFKLAHALSMLKLNAQKVPYIVELVRHAYNGTPDLKTGIDDLRDLVCQYAAANVKVLSEHEMFEELIEEGGAFVSDLWKRVLPRIK
ncbi:hypothetical protein N431DRAFT_517078 [Stipitochalara longipes BDJ]|nr:hypothetical protein N431DRAFT_517078 [Stipitochalara longipes BDJ]